MKARGSAIIIAMLMITAIGGIAFAIGRLLFIESTSASYYVNGSIAYYAAESGMEEGFLRYRYRRNAEVPFASWALNTPNLALRSNLSDSVMTGTGTAYAGIDKATQILSSDIMDQTYDLRMGYIGTNGSPWFGPPKRTPSTGLPYAVQQASSNTADPYYVKKDDAIKIDLTGFDIGSYKLMLYTKFFGDATTNPLSTAAQKCNALMEIKFTTENADGTFSELKSLLNYDPTICTGVAGSATAGMSSSKLYRGINMYTVSDTLYMAGFRLQDVIDIQNHSIVPIYQAPPASKKVSLFLKPLFYDAVIGIVSDTCHDGVTDYCYDKKSIVSGPSTKIESTGYFGGTTRKLEADIDRQSGTLYDLFDYVIYKGS